MHTSRFNSKIAALTCLVILLGFLLPSKSLYGQAGLRESLERLDRNENGKIEPDEITPLARPYLERIAGRRLQLDRSNDISALQEAGRLYHALRNGVVGNDVVVQKQSKSAIMSFGPKADEPLLPEFGMADVKYPYTKIDLEEADRMLRRSDANKDGFIDRSEAVNASWTHNDPFEMDIDHNDKLSRLELAQRYARRRLLSGASQELIQKAKRTGNGIPPSAKPEATRSEDYGWWRRGGSNQWLSASVMSRFDLNRDGRLEEQEAQALGIPMGRMDIDRNGDISRDELQSYLKAMQDEAGDESTGLPGWFFELDENRDGQVEMAEFTKEWSAEKLQEFELLDSNTDGLLTSAEVAQSKSQIGGNYRNANAQVLPPHKTVISEIEITDDFVIRELTLQLSITHTQTGYLDAFLTGPDGQRIELFSEVGGSGDHFDRTIFDDKADTPIMKGASPFTGNFQTMALVKRQPSLNSYIGKSAKGVWQLVIRGTRSERFGMLHDWSLRMKSRESESNTPKVQVSQTPGS